MAAAKPLDGSEVRPHPLVAKLCGDDAKSPPRLVRLVGFPGPSPVEGTVRLWLNLDFTDYVDVPNDKIAHCEEGADDKPSTLFVVKGTRLEYTSVVSTDVEADFLSGAITAGSLQGAAAAERVFALGLSDVITIDDTRNHFTSQFIACVSRRIVSCLIFCNGPSRAVFLCDTILQAHCFQVTPPGIPHLGTPVFAEIGRQVVAAAGLNPQPLPPAAGPLTRPAG